MHAATPSEAKEPTWCCPSIAIVATISTSPTAKGLHCSPSRQASAHGASQATPAPAGSRPSGRHTHARPSDGCTPDDAHEGSTSTRRPHATGGVGTARSTVSVSSLAASVSVQARRQAHRPTPFRVTAMASTSCPSYGGS